MFSDFQPEPQPATITQTESRRRLAALDMARAEMIHHALILADQDSLGRIDELTRTDYRAARERFDEAARAIEDTKTDAVAEASIRFLSHVHPSRLQLINGGRA